MTHLAERLRAEGLPFGAVPTPLQGCPQLSRPGFEVALKRDDLIGDLVTGTKVRALAHILGQAARDGVTQLITLGEPTSNQCRLVAMLGARVGMQVHLLLRASTCDDAEDENLAIMRMHGATLHLLDEGEWRLSGMAAKRLSSRARKAGGKALFLPFGCGGLPGALGIVGLVRELLEQHDGQLPYTHVLIPTGSGATAFAFDLALSVLRAPGPRPRLIGVSVAQDAPSLEAKIDQLYAKTSAALETSLARSSDLRIDDRWATLSPADRLSELARVVERSPLVPDPLYVLPSFLCLEHLDRELADEGGTRRVLVLVSGSCRTLGALRRRAAHTPSAHEEPAQP